MLVDNLQRKRVFAIEVGHAVFVAYQTGTGHRHTFRLADVTQFVTFITCRNHQDMTRTYQL